MKPMKYRVYKHPAESFHVQDISTGNFMYMRMNENGGYVPQHGNLAYRIQFIREINNYHIGWRKADHIQDKIQFGKRQLIGEFSRLQDVSRIQEIYPEWFI